MIYIKKAIINIKVHRYKSILTCIICLLMVILFHLYLANINSNQQQLKDLSEIMPISAKIVNLNGSQEVNLAIKDEIIQKLQTSKYIDREIYTVRSMGSIGKFEPEDWQEHLTLWVLSSNTLESVVDLNDSNITWKEGNDSGFLQEKEAKCIVSQELMEDKQWNLGDTIPLYQYYYYYGRADEIYMDPLDMTSFEIVGYTQFPKTSYDAPDILLPFQTERTIFVQNEIPFFADSASFYVKDPLKLDEFKKEMKGLMLLPVSIAAEATHDGNALSVRDSDFITAASKLRQVLDILIGFSAIILVIVIGIGYISSYLLLQGRKEEIAIMRSLGLSNKTCFLIMILESSIISATGITVGSLVAFFGFSSEIGTIAIGEVLAFGCYTAGTYAALIKFGKISVMEALTRID